MVKSNQRFERVAVSRDEALSMFQENKFKARAAVDLSTPLTRIMLLKMNMPRNDGRVTPRLNQLCSSLAEYKPNVVAPPPPFLDLKGSNTP